MALAPSAEVRENMELASLDQVAWKDVKTVRSSVAFADATTGNVMSRDGVEMASGKPAYLSTRLKVSNGQVTEAEISADLDRAQPSYVFDLPKVLTTVVPPAARITRDQLDALAHRYFQSLTDHVGIPADFDEARCNRFHSGNQVTNLSANAVEAAGSRTCFSSIDGPKPWGPAIEQRFPVIDVEHGIVHGLTLLMYANQVMYVSEVFKVENARIVLIDNIGIVKPGLEHTTGFGSKR